jgi:lipopolysaccharide transport system permease protein
VKGDTGTQEHVYGEGKILPMEILETRPTTRQFHRLNYVFDLLRELVVRDMKLRYKRSLLGLTWSLLNPLVQLLVFHFIFSLVLPLNIPNYALFLFTGILVWSWFQSSLSASTGAIVDNRELIRRPGFPVAVLPIVTVTTNLIHFLFALPILLIFLVLMGIPLTGALLALPLVIILQFLLILAITYFLATFHVTFRDTQYLVGISLLLGFYLTPIFYTVDNLPARYQAIYNLNPLVHLLGAYRSILIDGTLPDLIPLLVLGILSLTLLLVGYRIFMNASYNFAEEL